MFSKSLFKQSCKANGVMWAIVTFAVCFMLCCVMLIAGNGNLGATKVAIEDTIIRGELESQTETRAVNYYDTAETALGRFDAVFAAETEKAVQSEAFMQIAATQGAEAAAQYAATTAYAAALADLQTYVADLTADRGYAPGSTEAQELQGIVFGTLNPMTADASGHVSYLFDSFYAGVGEQAPRYDLTGVTDPDRAAYRGQYVMTNSSIFLAGNMTQEENMQKVLDALQDFGVTRETYAAFGFDKYDHVKGIARSALVNYRANLAYRLENLQEGETPESVRAEVAAKVSGSLFAGLPTEVTDALTEIGSSDLYGVLVGSIFFKMAGLLLPIIYMIMTANALIAGQVDSGSMAYVLSSSTKRREVTFTQAVYLVGSLLAMFACTAITGTICFAIVDVNTKLTYGKMLLLNLGAFVVLFAMSGLCFLASCVFNRSKHSMAIGGGLNMFFLVATMLGLFGSPVLPSIIRMSALNAFNYVSLISLFDAVSILEGTTTFIWKLAILGVVGLACYIAGSIRFEKKDLPL